MMMKRLKIAMMSMTHGHTRKYYDVLKNNPKLEWIAVSTANEEVRQVFLDKVDGIPCYDSDEAMLDAHPEWSEKTGAMPEQQTAQSEA